MLTSVILPPIVALRPQRRRIGPLLENSRWSTAMWYTVPPTASKDSPLYPGKVKQANSSSSLAATNVPGKALPVYTARSVSEALPNVVKTNLPLSGACHLYHTDPVPTRPACCGSFGSLVAPTLVPKMRPCAPRIGWASAKLSFEGGSTKLVRLLPAVTGPTMKAAATIKTANTTNQPRRV